MKRYVWSDIVALLVALPAMAVLANTPSDKEVDERARAIHQRVLTLDSHVDVLLPSTPERYYAQGHKSRADLDKLNAVESTSLHSLLPWVLAPKRRKDTQALALKRMRSSKPSRLL